MPLYEYHCSKCGKTFELIQRFSDAPLEVHEGCGGPVEKLVSAPAFHLKGSGWYATDYAKGGAKPADGKDAKGEAKSDGKSESGGDSKSDSKSESKTETKTESKTESKSDSSSSTPSPAKSD